jgi:hypothetical protein
MVTIHQKATHTRPGLLELLLICTHASRWMDDNQENRQLGSEITLLQ